MADEKNDNYRLIAAAAFQQMEDMRSKAFTMQVLWLTLLGLAMGRQSGRISAAEGRRIIRELEAIPAKLVGEIHLAGHTLDDEGTLLIDSHDAPIDEDVWQLYENLVSRIGPTPTLIERDGNVPAFTELMAERERGQAILRGSLAVAA